MVVSQFEGQSVSWEEDYSNRVNPSLMTKLLHDAIPVLKSVDWQVKEVREGVCISELPLCFASTNQHGTHQAALISLSADYTGGLALATLLRGIPLAGVHRCKEENSASLWLAAMDVKYRSPSTGHLQATCIVPDDVARMVRQRAPRRTTNRPGGRHLGARETDSDGSAASHGSGRGRKLRQVSPCLESGGLVVSADQPGPVEIDADGTANRTGSAGLRH